jgi:hypothetical protein
MQDRSLRKATHIKIAIRVLVGLIVFLSFFSYGLKPLQAFDPQNYSIDTITVFKVYNAERQLEQRRVLITGQYLKDASVGMITSSGYQELKDRINNSEGLLQFNINQDQTGNYLVIEGLSIALNEGAMPGLSGVNRKVRVGLDDLHISGTNLSTVKYTPGLSAGYEHEGAYTALDKGCFDSDSEVAIPKPGGALGLQNLIFEKTETSSYELRPGINRTVEITIKHTYLNQFRFVQDISVQGLEMYPNRGEAGSKLIFQAPHPQLNTYEVFFLKNIDGTDPYTSVNQGKNRTFQSNVNHMDILTVEVPNLPVGEYYVVLTNPVAFGFDPMNQVVQELIVGQPQYQKYTVIDANIKSVILSVQPASGPDTGSRVTISGQFFGTLNIPEFVPDETTILTPDPPVNSKELLLTYGPGTYRGTPIKEVQRKLKVIIGDQATFLPRADGSGYEVSFNADLDIITVHSAQVADAVTDPRKDVVVETETILTRADDKTIVFTERASLSNGYTYIPSKIQPQIVSMSPDRIQVIASGGHYVVPEDRMAAITGNNFAVTRFIDAQGQEILRYPILELGPELLLDKNTQPELYVRVFDKNGREVDGTEGNELGTRILFMIPADSSLNTLGKNYLKVTNPIKNSPHPGLSAQRPDFISFVNPEASRQPVITGVNPDAITVDGGESIEIAGSNFMSGVKVFIDGWEISPISRQEDGKRITLQAPSGREGETQLQVMNPEGAMDTALFTYVLTYTNPKISGFAPKLGKTGTLVMVKGDNFLKPEPSSGESSPLKLIGTRVMMEGREINQYNRDPVTNKIELQNYVNNEQPLLRIQSGGGASYLELADYYQAVLLQANSPGKELFTLDKAHNGEITLSNGSDLTYKLEVNPDKQVEAVLSNGFRALLTLSGSSWEIAGSPPLRLDIKTLYQVNSSNHFTGKRVEVVDSETLLFTVPVLEADGYYDLTVINPDTKKDSRVDEAGFYYYKMPLSRPEITAIEPDQGSTQGGYTIDIKGREFEDNGNTKVKVFINGMEIKAADTQVNSSGDMITVKVPAYPGDLRQDKSTDRLTVPVVIVNPDGGSAGVKQGFTYVVPSSHPFITALTPSKGSGVGQEVVEITGSDFRYFEPYDDANRNQIRDPNEPFSDLNHNNRWDSEIDIDDPLTDWRAPVALNHSQYDHYYDSPILPRIYFGQERARIVEFARGYVKVLTPSAAAGTAKVYLLNNDAGISNTVNYSYEALTPRITSLVPAQGPKQGRQYLEMFGSGFANTAITVLHDGSIETLNMPAVRFGSIDNRSIPSDQPNSGRIDNGLATVQLAGGLTVEYQAGNTLKLRVEEKGHVFEQVYSYDDTPVYIDLGQLRLQGDENTSYGGYELLKVSVEERRLVVERGYAPQVEMLSGRQLAVKTPSYYTIGVVAVRLYNPDGSQAQAQYEYKNPDSHPQIVNITRDGNEPQVITIGGQSRRILKMDYRSRAVISVLGQDFREGARIQVGDLFNIESKDIDYELPGKLSFVMPLAAETAVGNLYRVVVVNQDGGTAASDQIPGETSIYLQFTSGESSPGLTSLSPAMGPASGGTAVLIAGSDFRSSIDGYDDSLEVYFGSVKVPDGDVSLLDYKTCRVITVPGSPGTVDVKLENPDGTVAGLAGAYTYISEPEVATVWDSAGNTRITELSILGGQQITIKGSGFLPGAVVIFNPVLAESASAAAGSPLYRTVGRTVEGRNVRESEPFYLQSGQAVAAQVLSPDTLLVTAPGGAIGSGGLLVKNPDGGASDILELPYDLPSLPSPGEVTAEIIHDSYADCDRYIKVHWTLVKDASQYEIYVLIDNEREYIGSTRLTSFVYQSLKPNRSYQFVVTAVGDFGSSPPSMKSNRVRTGSQAGNPDSDGSPGEYSQTVRKGNQVFYSIGTRDDSRGWFLDLTQGQLAGATEVEVAIPAALISRNSSSDLRIRGRDFEISISPAVFNTHQVRTAARQDDAGIRLKIAPAAPQTGAVSGNLLSTPYSIEAQFYQGVNQSRVDNLSGSFALLLSYDQYKAQLRQLRTVMPCRLDTYQGAWVPLEAEFAGGWISLDSLGTYGMIGKRG